jgi:hypothetical protein
MNKKPYQDQGFNTLTYDSPQEAFLASVMENSGVNWPRKNLGKPAKGGRGRGAPRGQSRIKKKKTY